MSIAPSPSAALLEAAALIAGLFAVRYFFLIVFPGQRWAERIARWARRLVAVAAIVPALRLFTLDLPGDGEAVMWFTGVGMLAAAMVLLLLDQMVADTVRPRNNR